MRPWFNILLVCSIILLLSLYSRSDSPLESINVYLKSKPTINIPVHINFAEPGFNFPDLIRASQLQLDHELYKLFPHGSPISITLIDNLRNTYNESDKVNYQINLILSNENSVAVDSDYLAAFVFYNLATVHANDLPFFITQSVIYHLLSPDIELLQQGFDHPFEYKTNFLVNLMVSPPLSLQLQQSVSAQLKNFTELLQPVANVSILYLDEPLSDAINIRYNLKLVEGFTEETLGDLIKLTTRQIHTVMGIPHNPSNNLPLKLLSVARAKSLHGLITCTDLLQVVYNQHRQAGAECRQKLYSLIDKLTQVNESDDWFALLQETSHLFHKLNLLIDK